MFRGLGIPGHSTRLRYFQRHSEARQFFRSDELAAIPRLAEQPKTRTQVLMLDEPPTASVSSPALLEHHVDDDLVIEQPSAALEAISAAQSVPRASSSSQLRRVEDAGQRETVLMRQAVGADVIQLVTDEFAEARKVQVARRRKVLYDLTHPNPADYTYGGKLVPPPPLSFGTVTPEAIGLGRRIMLGQHYSLVKEAPSSDYFFEINDIYQEIVFVGKANAGKSSLINALLGQPEMAKTSSTPNSTRKANFYQAVSAEELSRFAKGNPNKLVKLPGGGLQLTFVDLPGFGVEGMSDRWRDNAIEVTDSYLGVRRSVNTVFLCIDCERGLTKADVRYFEWLENLHGMFFVLLTKCDTVPHSRVCSVMRQVYQLMTKQRRKYRKAFPFVLPVSAATGTNLDELRGLVAETSGLIAGDRLREILKAKGERERTKMEELTNSQLRQMWISRRDASVRQFALEQRGGGDSTHCSVLEPQASQSPNKGNQQNQREVLLASSVDIDLSSAGGLSDDMTHFASDQYGGAAYRLSTGLHNKETIQFSGSRSSDAEEGRHDSEGVKTANGASEAQPRMSAVQKYFNTLDEFAVSCDEAERLKQFSTIDGQSKQVMKENRFERQLKGGGTRVFSVEDDGRYQQYKGGVAVGPLLPGLDSSPRNRRSEWKAKQLMTLAAKVRPDAPWEGIAELKKDKANAEQNKVRMSPKEWAAYTKNAGRIIEGFDRFENEVTMSKQMTEIRQVKTLRKQQQLHLNATAKIGFRQQPPGLLKDYGGMATYNPTSRILGL